MMIIVNNRDRILKKRMHPCSAVKIIYESIRVFFFWSFQWMLILCILTLSRSFRVRKIESTL